MSPKQEPASPLAKPPDPFGEFITDFKEGMVDVQVTQALAEVVQGVQTWAKPGSITLKIKVAPNKTDARYVEIVESIEAKVPTATPEARLLFGTPTGRITAKNPHQSSLGFEREEQPPKNVHPITGEIDDD